MNILNNLNPINWGKSKTNRPVTVQELMKSAKVMKRVQAAVMDLQRQTDGLTKKDIESWRQAWQVAIDIESPNRTLLYDVYTDALIDLHLTGCISQRKGKTLQKSFKLVNKEGKEVKEATEIFENEWFFDFLDLALDSRFWGHSLIQFGDIINDDMGMRFEKVELVPRKHVVQEYGIITPEPGGDWRNGFYYRDGELADWCIEVGKSRDLGLLLKCAPQSLSKKNMLTFWDMFGEIFGMPIRVAKTSSHDDKDIAQISDALDGMGAAFWGLFPDGTDIDIKESSRGDAFNVYDKRVDRCNSEISKGILNQTMTIDSGSSLSQSETHLEVFENVCRADARQMQYVVNNKLIPLMIRHNFPLSGIRFAWDESINYTPEQQIKIEEMILQNYEVDENHFAEKYNIKIIGKKQPNADSFFG